MALAYSSAAWGGQVRAVWLPKPSASAHRHAERIQHLCIAKHSILSFQEMRQPSSCLTPPRCGSGLSLDHSAGYGLWDPVKVKVRWSAHHDALPLLKLSLFPCLLKEGLQRGPAGLARGGIVQASGFPDSHLCPELLSISKVNNHQNNELAPQVLRLLLLPR